MKRAILFLLTIPFFLFACEKENNDLLSTNTPADEPTTAHPFNEELIVGKWKDWNYVWKTYDSLNNVRSYAMASFNNSVIFSDSLTIKEYRDNRFNGNGTYAISGNVFKLTLESGWSLNMLHPNPFSGYLDSLTTNRLVFRDTTFHPHGNYDIIIYSATRQN